MNIRGKVLRDADHCINGEREGQYGSPEDNFKKIAILWSDYLNLTNKVQLSLSAADVAKMMVLFKLARSMGPQDKYDNYVDLIGYAACAAESKSVEDPSLIGFEHIKPDEIVEINGGNTNTAKTTFIGCDRDIEEVMDRNADVEKAFNMVRAIENPQPTETIAKLFNKGRGWEACEDCLHAESDRDMCVSCKKLQGLKPSNWKVKPVQHNDKDYNCLLCANNNAVSTVEPCLSCKPGIPNGSNFVPKNTINRVCTTCVNQFMDRDMEPCLSCDPKTKSNWIYEL